MKILAFAVLMLITPAAQALARRSALPGRTSRRYPHRRDLRCPAAGRPHARHRLAESGWQGRPITCRD